MDRFKQILIAVVLAIVIGVSSAAVLMNSSSAEDNVRGYQDFVGADYGEIPEDAYPVSSIVLSDDDNLAIILANFDNFTVRTYMDLQKIADITNGIAGKINPHDLQGNTFYLANDIDMSDVENFTPIGNSSETPFCGILNGMGHVIYNLTIDMSDPINLSEYASFIGHSDETTLVNLALGDCDIRGYSFASGFFGSASDRTEISNCHTFGGSIQIAREVKYTVNSDPLREIRIGGLVCEHMVVASTQLQYAGLDGFRMENCSNSADLYAETWGSSVAVTFIGGAMAREFDTYRVSSIINVSNYGDVTVKGGVTSGDIVRAGGVLGLVGNNTWGSEDLSLCVVSNCYNVANVTVDLESVASAGSNIAVAAGGLVGKSNASLAYCYNTGIVRMDMGSTSSEVGLGGISGYVIGSVEYCYNLGDLYMVFDDKRAAGYMGGIAGSTIKTSESRIIGCYNTGDATIQVYKETKATGTNVAGIAGDNSLPISNCYNTGNIILNPAAGSDYLVCNAGGIVAYDRGDGAEGIVHCYNTGKIGQVVSEGKYTNCGGIAGKGKSDTIQECAFLYGSAQYVMGCNQSNYSVKDCYIFDDQGMFSRIGNDKFASERSESPYSRIKVTTGGSVKLSLLDMLSGTVDVKVGDNTYTYNSAGIWDSDGNDVNSGYPVLKSTLYAYLQCVKTNSEYTMSVTVGNSRGGSLKYNWQKRENNVWMDIDAVGDSIKVPAGEYRVAVRSVTSGVTLVTMSNSVTTYDTYIIYGTVTTVEGIPLDRVHIYFGDEDTYTNVDGTYYLSVHGDQGVLRFVKNGYNILEETVPLSIYRESGSNILENASLTASSISSIAETDYIYDKGLDSALAIELYLVGSGTVTGVTYNGEPVNYSVTAGVLTIPGSYFSDLSLGKYSFVISFSDPLDNKITINVEVTESVSPSLGSPSSDFDKRNPGNVTYSINWGSGTLSATEIDGIYFNGIPLTYGVDYLVSGNTLVLNSSYLRQLPVVTAVLKVSFAGEAKTLAHINAVIKNTADIAVSLGTDRVVDAEFEMTQGATARATDEIKINISRTQGVTAGNFIVSVSPSNYTGAYVSDKVSVVGVKTDGEVTVQVLKSSPVGDTSAPVGLAYLFFVHGNNVTMVGEITIAGVVKTPIKMVEIKYVIDYNTSKYVEISAMSDAYSITVDESGGYYDDPMANDGSLEVTAVGKYYFTEKTAAGKSEFILQYGYVYSIHEVLAVVVEGGVANLKYVSAGTGIDLPIMAYNLSDVLDRPRFTLLYQVSENGNDWDGLPVYSIDGCLGTTIRTIGGYVRLTLIQDEGYSVSEWKVNNVTFARNTNTIILQNNGQYVSANYGKANYNVTAEVNNSSYGSVTGSGSYDYGELVTLTAIPSAGYHFAYWIDAATGEKITGADDLVYSFYISNSSILEYKAYFSKAIITGTVSLNGSPVPHATVSWGNTSAIADANGRYVLATDGKTTDGILYAYKQGTGASSEYVGDVAGALFADIELKQQFTEGDFTYSVLPGDSDSVSVAEYLIKDKTTDVIVSETVSYAKHTYTVTEIGAEAFEGTKVNTVQLPNTVMNVGSWAFADCENLLAMSVPIYAEFATDALTGSNNLYHIRLTQGDQFTSPAGDYVMISAIAESGWQLFGTVDTANTQSKALILDTPHEVDLSDLKGTKSGGQVLHFKSVTVSTFGGEFYDIFGNKISDNADLAGMTFEWNPAADGGRWEEADWFEITFTDGQTPYLMQLRAHGSKVSEPAEPVREGYTFTGWFDASTGEVWDFDTDTVKKDMVLNAGWNPVEITVTYQNPKIDTNKYTDPKKYTVEGDPVIVLQNTILTAPEGMEFLEWNTKADGSGTAYQSGNVVRPTENLTLYAIWGYEVSATLNIDNAAATGKEVSLYAPLVEGESAFEGRTFALAFSSTSNTYVGNVPEGSYQVCVGGQKIGMTITVDSTAPSWAISINCYTIDYKQSYKEGTMTVYLSSDNQSDYGDYPLLPESYVASGAIITPKAVPYGGYYLSQFEINSQKISVPYTVTSSVTIYAVFGEDGIKVSYVGGEGTTGNVPVERQYGPGDTITVYGNTGNLAKTGMVLVGWGMLVEYADKTTDTGFYFAGETYEIDGSPQNITFTAVWGYKVTVNYTRDGQAWSSGDTVELKGTSDYAGKIYEPVYSGSQYVFYVHADQKYEMCINDDTQNVSVDEADVLISREYYTVTFVTGEGHTEVPVQTVLSGGKASEPSIPEGYSSVTWHVGSTGGTVWNFENPVDETKVLYAEWTKTTSKITFTNGNLSGTVNGNPITSGTTTVSVGDIIIITPGPGYEVDRGKTAGAVYVSENTYRATGGDVSFTAVQLTYSISYYSNGGEGYVGSAVVKYGELFTFNDGSKITRDGYTLLGWSVSPVSSAPEYTPGLVISSWDKVNGMILYAVWMKITLSYLSIVEDETTSTERVVAISGNDSGNGWRFEHSTSTLTLTNGTFGPITATGDLNIVLEGSDITVHSHIKTANNYWDHNYAIYCTGDLNISGDTLNVVANSAAVEGSTGSFVDGIVSDGVLTLSCKDVTVTGNTDYSVGIYAFAGLNVNMSGVLTIYKNCPHSSPIYGNIVVMGGDITILKGTVTLESHTNNTDIETTSIQTSDHNALAVFGGYSLVIHKGAILNVNSGCLDIGISKGSEAALFNSGTINFNSVSGSKSMLTNYGTIYNSNEIKFEVTGTSDSETPIPCAANEGTIVNYYGATITIGKNLLFYDVSTINNGGSIVNDGTIRSVNKDLSGVSGSNAILIEKVSSEVSNETSLKDVMETGAGKYLKITITGPITVTKPISVEAGSYIILVAPNLVTSNAQTITFGAGGSISVPVNSILTLGDGTPATYNRNTGVLTPAGKGVSDTLTLNGSDCKGYVIKNEGTLRMYPNVTIIGGSSGAVDNYSRMAMYGGDIESLTSNNEITSKNEIGVNLSSNALFMQFGGLIKDLNTGINVSGGSTAFLYTGEISGNEAKSQIIDGTPKGGNGGGVSVSEKSYLELWDVTITGNTAVNGGGVSVESNSTVVINGGSVSNNTTTGNGGGVYVDDQSAVVLYDGLISNNAAGGHGGGMDVDWSFFLMEGGEISGNKTTTGDGGGIEVEGSISVPSLVTISGGLISNNEAHANGGGIAVTHGVVEISGSSFITGNTAGENGGGIYMQADSAGIRDSYVRMTDSSSLAFNFATEGSGIYLANMCTVIFEDSAKVDSSDNIYLSWFGGNLDKGEHAPISVQNYVGTDVIALLKFNEDDVRGKPVVCFHGTNEKTPDPNYFILDMVGIYLKVGSGGQSHMLILSSVSPMVYEYREGGSVRQFTSLTDACSKLISGTGGSITLYMIDNYSVENTVVLGSSTQKIHITILPGSDRTYEFVVPSTLTIGQGVEAVVTISAGSSVTVGSPDSEGTIRFTGDMSKSLQVPLFSVKGVFNLYDATVANGLSDYAGAFRVDSDDTGVTNKFVYVGPGNGTHNLYSAAGSDYLYDNGIYTYVGQGGNTGVGSSIGVGSGSGTYVQMDLGGGVFNMYGGEIFGCQGVAGGAVVTLTSDSVFNMFGGVISGNEAVPVVNGFAGGAGGVFNLGVMTMSGGTISGNTGADGAVHNSGLFVMTGGKIADNEARSAESNETHVGGVHLGTTNYAVGNRVSTQSTQELKFYMTGGEISGNAGTVGGVYLSEGEFRISGGNITLNEASGNGGGVYISESTKMYMSGGSIVDNSAVLGPATYVGGLMYLSGLIEVDGIYITKEYTESCGIIINGDLSTYSRVVVILPDNVVNGLKVINAETDTRAKAIITGGMVRSPSKKLAQGTGDNIQYIVVDSARLETIELEDLTIRSYNLAPTGFTVVLEEMHVTFEGTAPENYSGFIEYAVSLGSTAPALGWQTETTFDSLEPDREYYFFARATGDPNYGDVTSTTSDSSKLHLPKATYTITASSGPNGTITPQGMISYAYGSQVTYTFKPEGVFQVYEVSVDGEAITGTEGSYTFDFINKDHIITVTFTKIVSIELMRDGEPWNNSGMTLAVHYGGEYTVFTNTTGSNLYTLEDGLPVGAHKVYSKVGIEYEDTGFVFNVTSTANTSAEMNYYTLKYDLEDGTPSSGEFKDTYHLEDSAAVIPNETPKKTGSEFVYWIHWVDSNGEIYNPGDEITIEAATTLDAVWGYKAYVDLQLNETSWQGQGVELRSGSEVFTLTYNNGKYEATVPEGTDKTYDVYVNDEDTNEDISSTEHECTVNYYSVSYSATLSSTPGTATAASISINGGARVASGTLNVLNGSNVTLQTFPVASTASHFTYAWNGATGTGDTATIQVTSSITISCEVSGVVAYDVSLTIKKNNESWTGATVSLVSGDKKFTLNENIGVYSNSEDNKVAIGTYDLYITTGTGEIAKTSYGGGITVSDGNVTKDVYMFGVTYSATNTGAATGASITARIVYGSDDTYRFPDDTVDTGDWILSGTDIEFTATGSGAVWYEYEWDSDASYTEATKTYTVSSNLSVTCTVTGYNGYDVSVIVKKDGEFWSELTTVELRQDGVTKCVLTGDANKYSVMAENGTYQVYVEGINTGKEVTVNEAIASVTTDFYSVKVSYDSGLAFSGKILSSQDTYKQYGENGQRVYAVLSVSNFSFTVSVQTGYEVTGDLSVSLSDSGITVSGMNVTVSSGTSGRTTSAVFTVSGATQIITGSITLPNTTPSYGGTATVSSHTVNQTGATCTYEWQISDDKTSWTKANAGILTSLTDYTIEKEDVGKYLRAVITGTGSYSGTITAEFKDPVGKAPITVSNGTDQITKEYDGTTNNTQTLEKDKEYILYGVITGDVVNIEYTGSNYNTENVSSGKIMLENPTLIGVDRLYYELTGLVNGKLELDATIIKAPINLAITSVNIVDMYDTLQLTASHLGAGAITWTWTRADNEAGEVSILNSVLTPIKIGNATITATVVETDNYLGDTKTQTITISPNKIDGTVTIGSTVSYLGMLTAVTSDITPEGVKDKLSYRWYSADNASGTDKIPIENAVSSSFTITDKALVGRYVGVEVTTTDPTNCEGSIQLENWVSVENQDVEFTVSIGNTNPQFGQTLNAVTSGAPEDAKFTYQWYRNGTEETNKIDEATGQSYTVTSVDIGKKLYVKTVLDSPYSGSKTSAATADVAKSQVTITVNSNYYPVEKEYDGNKGVIVSSLSDYFSISATGTVPNLNDLLVEATYSSENVGNPNVTVQFSDFIEGSPFVFAGETAPALILDGKITAKEITIIQTTSYPAISKVYDGNTNVTTSIAYGSYYTLSNYNSAIPYTAVYNDSNVESANKITVTFSAPNSNYVLKDATNDKVNIQYDAKIDPLPAILKWNYSTPYTYQAGITHTVSAGVQNVISNNLFIITYTDNSKVDSGNYIAQVTLLGNKNYTLTDAQNVSLNWAIAEKPIQYDVEYYNNDSVEELPIVYDGVVHGIRVTSTVSGFTIKYREGSNGDFTLDSFEKTDADTYEVYFKITATDHTDTIGNISWTIDKKPIVVGGDNAKGTYDGDNVFEIPGTGGNPTIIYTTSSSDVGIYGGTDETKTYSVSFKVDGFVSLNYEAASDPGIFTINPAAITVKQVSSYPTISKVYDGNTNVITSIAYGDSGHYTLEGYESAIPYTAKYNDPNAGINKTVTVTFSAPNSNYVLKGATDDGGVNIEYVATITKAGVTVTGIAQSSTNAITKVYDGGTEYTGLAKDTHYSVTSTGSIPTLTSSATFDSPNAGTRTLTVKFVFSESDADNYEFLGGTDTLVITGCSITPLKVDVKWNGGISISKIYDGNNSADVYGLYTISPKTDVETAITGTSVVATYESASAGSNNKVTAIFTVSSNYTFDENDKNKQQKTLEFNNGVIGKAEVTVSPATTYPAITKVYDGTTDVKDLITTAFYNVTSTGAIPAIKGYSKEYNSPDVVSATNIIVVFKIDGDNKDNFEFESGGNTIELDASITPYVIDVSDRTFYYNGSNEREVTVSGAGNEGSKESVTLKYEAYSKDAGTYTYTSESLATGTYTISFVESSGVSNSNYALSVSKGNMFIAPMELMLNAVELPYNGSNEYKVTVDGVGEEGSKESVVLTYVAHSVDLTIKGEYAYAVTGTADGTFSIVLDDTNYKLPTTGIGMLKVTSVEVKMVQITGTTVTKVYDGTNGAPAMTRGIQYQLMVDTGNNTSRPALASTSAELDVSYTATYGSEDVGDNLTVGITNLALIGTKSGNYTISQPSANFTGSITPLTVIIVPGIEAVSKVYDGTINCDASLTRGTHYQILTQNRGSIPDNDLVISGCTKQYASAGVGNPNLNLSDITLSNEINYVLSGATSYYLLGAITAAPGTDFLTFTFPEIYGSAVINDASHTITANADVLNLSAIAPTFTLSPGATSNIGSGVARDFGNLVTYTIKAQDGTSQDWTVTITPGVAVYYKQNGETGTPDSQWRGSTGQITLNDGSTLSRPGFSFLGWNTYADASGTHYSAGFNYVANSSITLFAEWKANAPSSAPAAQSVTQSEITLTSTNGYEYSIDGTSWQTSPVFSGLKPETSYTLYQRVAATVTSLASASSPALTVVTLSGYTIVYDANGGTGTVPVDSKKYAGGESFVPAAADLRMEGDDVLHSWNTSPDGSGTQYIPGRSSIINSNLVLYAQYAPDTTRYAITVTDSDYGTTVPGSTTVQIGHDITFEFRADSGCYVEDVTLNGVSLGSISSYTITDVRENMTLSVTYAEHWFSLVSMSGDNGTVSPEGTVSLRYGSDYSYVITAAEGFTIADVLVDGVSVGSVEFYRFENIVSDHTISATFGDESYDTIRVKVDSDKEDTSVKVNGIPVVDGSVAAEDQSTAKLEAVPGEGYHFTSFTINGVETEITDDQREEGIFLDIPVDGDIVIGASTGPNYYHQVIVLESGGIIAESEEVRYNAVFSAVRIDADTVRWNKDANIEYAAAYEISAYTSNGKDPFLGTMTVTFSVGTQFDGNVVLVYHKVSEDRTDVYECVVSDGLISIEIESMSPFLVVLPAVFDITLVLFVIFILAGISFLVAYRFVRGRRHNRRGWTI